MINACNSCFKVLNIVQNIDEVNNVINFSMVSNLPFVHPNFQILHLPARFIVDVGKCSSEITARSAGNNTKNSFSP